MMSGFFKHNPNIVHIWINIADQTVNFFFTGSAIFPAVDKIYEAFVSVMCICNMIK